MALTTAQVAACARVPVTTLNYWVSHGVVAPTLVPPSGQRSPRFWSVQDVVIVRAVKALRDAGCSLQKVSKVRALLEARHDLDLAAAVLIYDGRDVALVDDLHSAAVGVLAATGQGMFVEVLQFFAMPLRPWYDEATRSSTLVDVGEYRRRNKARARAKAERATDTARWAATQSVVG